VFRRASALFPLRESWCMLSACWCRSIAMLCSPMIDVAWSWIVVSWCRVHCRSEYKYIHLTNYCQQKYAPSFEKFEAGNTLSFADLETLLDSNVLQANLLPQVGVATSPHHSTHTSLSTQCLSLDPARVVPPTAPCSAHPIRPCCADQAYHLRYIQGAAKHWLQVREMLALLRVAAPLAPTSVSLRRWRRAAVLTDLRSLDSGSAPTRRSSTDSSCWATTSWWTQT
jgi:hypothetical protein